MAKLDLLTGMKVVDMSSFLACPVAAKLLGEYGADVIRVENPNGDAIRNMSMTMFRVINGDAPLYDTVNGNKKMVAIDTTKPEGIAILYKLLEDADVFICHLQEKNLKQLGLDYDTLHAKFPGLIVANTTGYGSTGPNANKAGYDGIAYVHHTGMNINTLREGSEPALPYMGQGDIPTGTYLAGGIMAAYIKKLRTGKGEKVSAHLYGAGIWGSMINVLHCQAPYNYHMPELRETHLPTYNLYKTKDEKWMLIQGGYPQAFANLLKCAQVADAEEALAKWPDIRSQMMNAPDVVKYLEGVFAAKTAAEWDPILEMAKIPHDVALSYKEIAEDEAAMAANLLQEVHYDYSNTTIRIPRSPVSFAEAGIPETDLPPLTGADTAEVLKTYGYSDEQIAEMAAAGLVGLGDTWKRPIMGQYPSAK